MKGPIRVWQLSNQRGFAGTERALKAWVAELRPPFKAKAFSREQGLPPLAGPKGPACEILHIHRHGERDAGWDRVISEAKAAGVPLVVETNVFGARDEGPSAGLLDHHFFVSAMCLWRHAGWPASLPTGHARRHSVLYNPLRRADFLPAISAARRLKARKALGLPKDAFVCGRLGRPDPNKWPAWLPQAFAKFAAAEPRAHLLLMQAPDFVRGECARLGIEGRVRFIQASADWNKVRQAYESLDCLAHGSRVGESFGYTLAEAQAFGIPVVADCTPWADNAQVEVVEHGVTGLLAGRPEAFSLALKRLAADPALAARLGAAGRATALKRFDAKALTRRLESCYLALLKGQSPAAQPDVASFGAGYRARLRNLEAPSPLKDAAWAATSALKLHWRGWISRGLKRLGLKRRKGIPG